MTSDRRPPGLTRRDVLRGAAALALAPAACAPSSALLREPDFSTLPDERTFAESPFALGVASGDPLEDRVILWTRLAADPLAADGGVPFEPVAVGWQIAADPLFQLVVNEGVVTARPEEAHSLHVDADGLSPDAVYWYRFFVRAPRSGPRPSGHVSPVGRTRTAPARDADVARLRIGLACCQDFEQGLFTAHRHLAREGCDLICFLGDYIYEGNSDDDYRQHATREPDDLASYRQRWAQYKAEPELQESHAACPWLCIWDDHEVVDDYAGTLGSDGEDPGVRFPARRLAAYRAFWEHTPIRAPRPTDADAGKLQLYRSLRWGRLAELLALDTRQYRTAQPCGGDEGEPCDGWPSEDDDILGAEQEAWVKDRLTTSDARWKPLVQSVVFSDITLNGTLIGFDQWDGYPLARQRLLDHVADNDVDGLLVFSGDIHLAGLSRLTQDPRDASSRLLGAEIVTNSIASGGDAGNEGDGLAAVVGVAVGAVDNLLYGFATLRGYTVVDLTPDECIANYKVVSAVTEPGGTSFLHSRWSIPRATPEPVEIP